MTDRKLMQQALEALDSGVATRVNRIDWIEYDSLLVKQAITALREMLAQPEQEFIKHNVDQPYDWSEWVCPDPDDYLIKCCDCGLVHQAQFRVAKYAPAPSEECEIVNDPDLQAQFRMRRHAVTKPQPDNWTPEDTAHRAGGLEQSVELEALLERQNALLERQKARIVDLQTQIDNFDGEDR